MLIVNFLRIYRWKALLWSCALILLAACTISKDDAQEERVSPHELESIQFFIDRLPDRSFVKSYGDADNPRTWYTAAEALGAMGKPAIPALIERLDTPDPYELKLVVYALMLASQDPALHADTGGDYLQLSTVLTESSNAANKEKARAWWERYQHLW